MDICIKYLERYPKGETPDVFFIHRACKMHGPIIQLFFLKEEKQMATIGYEERLFAQMPKGDLFFSPLSIKACLSLAAIGAARNTRAQLVATLDLPNRDREILNWLTESASPSEGVTWNVANRMFGEQSYAFEPAFIRLMQDISGFEPVDFWHQANVVRGHINDWVADATRQKILDLLPDGALNPLTRLVLTNAVYFKGGWSSKFNEADTHFARFEGAGSVRTMYQNQLFAYEPGETTHRIWLPYQGEEFGMLIVMPREGVPLSAAEQEIATIGWQQMRPYRNWDVHLWMPKWKYTWGTEEITPALMALGIRDAFDDAADFTPMSQKGRDLFVSGVYHKAFNETNEEGTEAAAATGTVMECLSISEPVVPPTVEVHIDRPFVYSIMNWRDIAFTGRVVDPTNEG